VLFRPLDIPVKTAGPIDRGWGELLRSVEVCEVPGHHHSMVALPHVTALAAILTDVLTAAAEERVPR
jgi:thioesterase domain-containing protein